MRHRKFTFKIGRTTAHRRSMLANASCSLLVEERICTTIARAKQIRRVTEKMITLGKRGTLHARRQAVAFLRDRHVVSRLFSEIAGRYEGRPGGYTRIARLGPRQGDAAEMCLLELVPATSVAEEVAAVEQADDAVTNAEPVPGDAKKDEGEK